MSFTLTVAPGSGLNVFPPQDRYAEPLTPNVMVLGGGALGRHLVMRVKPSYMGLVPFKRDPRETPCLSHRVRAQGEDSRLWKGPSPHANLLAPKPPSPWQFCS